MADENDVLTDLDTGNAAPNGADNQPSAGIISQYVKDLSVENPNAPSCYQWEDSPQVDVQFNIASSQVNEEVHEVELKVNVTAKGEKGEFYLVELAYAGLIGLRNIPEEQAHAFLFAEAPRLLFPFLRRVVADAVQDAGFPPLQLDPVDFNGLYVQQMQAKRQQEAAAGAGETPPAEQA